MGLVNNTVFTQVPQNSHVALVERTRLPMRKTWAQFLSWEDPLEEGTATHFSLVAGESHGQRSLTGYGPEDHKESDMTEMTQRRCMGSLIITNVSN